MYTNTLKIHMVCVTYIQQIYFFQHSISYFIYLSYFVFKKTEIRVKPGHLQQINKNYGSVIFCKASFIFLKLETLKYIMVIIFFICT